ncbi:UDP-glucose 4-epimerase GalE [Dichelobacter nodosus]|uniref:UDP-glucose 4-epimerase n=1 Tax=Dichelobacter nodosus (strain VCS1703A) TaxID=246195 RepID=A5EY53_DICNV|nr:UDP-glucose 4-epimerase GalE [Dichelobacter nodosus]ABQ13609.1 UDP-glucose 4-epimerase [Dichelobacter nodosus VCS1703A]AXM45731.1 UDP-glucose 4-epimerase GalE [Dichelobacter nodosus]KNZ39192.1 UDP-glucose 4-epimerase [Dichelobacter nodosus]TGA64505.1 UDP-glucose 4-epimerase GalE [Dichelobacter nodosus]
MILITGGAGYIGSHTTLLLLNQGYELVVLDNLSNSSPESLRRVAQLTGKNIPFVKGDIRDRALLDQLFCDYPINAVMNFAGLKAVGESVAKPLDYYHCNVYGATVLLQAMQEAKIKTFVFSSSATVYGDPIQNPIDENYPTQSPTNPYGATKLMIERMLSDVVRADNDWNIAILRYFNPIGAHESGEIGEDPNGIPNNLLPYIARVATGVFPHLSVFGDDYPTQDGTGVRDYIHVMDLAQGHLDALNVIEQKKGLHIWNLGTGTGYSVLEIIHAFERASGKNIPYQIAPRRQGDIAMCYANPAKAERELGWKATRDLETMMKDTWRWQTKNPNGYR